MKSTQNLLVVFVILAVLGLTACSDDDSGSGTLRFETTLWELVSYTEGGAKAHENLSITEQLQVTSVLPGSTITAVFDGVVGQVYGSSGCNQYTGGFAVDGTTLSITDLAVTLRNCNEPPGVMEQEQSYLATLEDAQSVALCEVPCRTMDSLLARRGQVETSVFCVACLRPRERHARRFP